MFLCSRLYEKEKVKHMSQQELNYDGLNRERPGNSSGVYEGEGTHGYHSYKYRDKLSAPFIKSELTAGQRLALAIVSLGMFLFLTFGLVGIAVGTHADGWVVFPILFVLVLFTIIAAIINIAFNRRP